MKITVFVTMDTSFKLLTMHANKFEATLVPIGDFRCPISLAPAELEYIESLGFERIEVTL